MKPPLPTYFLTTDTRRQRVTALLGLLTALSACNSQGPGGASAQSEASSIAVMPVSAEVETAITAEARLAQVLDQQSAE